MRRVACPQSLRSSVAGGGHVAYKFLVFYRPTHRVGAILDHFAEVYLNKRRHIKCRVSRFLQKFSQFLQRLRVFFSRYFI